MIDAFLRKLIDNGVLRYATNTVITTLISKSPTDCLAQRFIKWIIRSSQVNLDKASTAEAVNWGSIPGRSLAKGTRMFTIYCFFLFNSS